jgi:hypothetical protein
LGPELNLDRIMRQYPYLIAGLPNLLPEQAEPPLSVAAYVELLRDHLGPEDIEQLDYLLLPAEHHNLLGALRGQPHEGRHPWARWDEVALRERLADGQGLPPYFHAFAEAFREEGQGAPPPADPYWDDRLAAEGYRYALAGARGFAAAWLPFERDLRNFITALNARWRQLDPSLKLVDGTAMAEAMALRPQARDFGLGADYFFVPELLEAYDLPNLLERERAIDMLRWRYAETINAFTYFTADVLLGYLVRLRLLDRWARLHPERGAEALRRLIDQPQMQAQP